MTFRLADSILMSVRETGCNDADYGESAATHRPVGRGALTGSSLATGRPGSTISTGFRWRELQVLFKSCSIDSQDANVHSATQRAVRQAALLTRWSGSVEPPRQVREPPAKKATRTKKERWRGALQRPRRHKSECQNDDHGQRDARDGIPSSRNDTNANGDEDCCHEKGDEVRNNPGLSNT